LTDLIGGTISHYRILSRLGAGGMGVVYRARDERLGRDLALKVLPAESMADPTARARLLREAQMASSLNHPHIAHIYEVGEDREHLFIAMELVEGRPLKDSIPPAGMPPDALLEYGSQIANALAYAHERGIVHRDLKSVNVMITPEGRVKVLDFGLAKRLDEPDQPETPRDLSLTVTGMVVGTPHYLPPEALLGGKADVRGDVWALGVVLYEMAAGRLPFSGETLATLAGAIVSGAPTPLSGRVPVGIQAVIARCLAKEPTQRYEHGGAVRAALDALAQGAASRRARVLRRRVWVPAAAAVVLAISAFLAFGPGGVRDRIAGGASRPRIASLAVLPLQNLSNDPTQEYFADGMTEELITNLAPIRSLTVISRTSVMRFKGSTQPLREIAKQLGVEGIIEGSVQRAGDRVRITAQLIEAARDRHLWAKSYERDFRDVLALQSDVASDIAQEIQLQISPQERAKMAHRRSVNPEAFEEYLRGRYEWSKMTDEGARAAIAHFERALALDPGDARYSSGLADAYLIQVQVISSVPTKEGMAKVKQYARQALGADEGSAEAHSSMAAALFFGDWDLAGAERHVRRAIELNPGYGTAHLVYSVLLLTGGRVDEALEQDRIAMQIDPLSLIVHWNAVGTLMSAGKLDEALALANQTFARNPESEVSQSGLVRVHEVRGEYEKALQLIRKYVPESERVLADRVEKAYREGGPKGYYRAYYEIASGMKGKPGAPEPKLAMLAANMGDLETAMKHLDRAYAEHNSDLLFLNVERCYDPMRKDPRFQALVRRVGLTPRA